MKDRASSVIVKVTTQQLSERGHILHEQKYNKSRSYIYFWKARWDRTVNPLACHSRKSHSHPTQHTKVELKLIRDMRRRNPDLGMMELWHRRGLYPSPRKFVLGYSQTEFVSLGKEKPDLQA